MTVTATTSETLTPETLADLSEYVVVDVRFKDPFNDVRGADAMANIFRHMFDTVGPVRFIVDDCAGDADTCMMSWRFEAILRGRPWTFDGTSVIKFAADGRVVEHVDHWGLSKCFLRTPANYWFAARGNSAAAGHRLKE